MAIQIQRIATDWQDVSGLGTRLYVPGQTIVEGVLSLQSGTDMRFETTLQGEEYQLYSELTRRIAERVTREMVAG